MRRFVAGFQKLSMETEERIERAAVARRTWSGGTEPIPAEAPRWPENSLGDRFFSRTFLREARKAPCLADAEIPAAPIIAGDPAHRNVSTNALIRAVLYDGLELDHPAVSALLEVLAPIAETELASNPGLDGPLAADALIGNFARRDRREQPGDAELLERIGHVEADALLHLVHAGAVCPADILPVGLTLLSALAQLCRSNSAAPA